MTYSHTHNQVVPVESSFVEEIKNEIKQIDRKKNMKKWFSGLFCGFASALTCCMGCGGCCGKIKSPAVLYEDEDYVKIPEGDKKVFNAIQWCGLCGLFTKTITTCGCCCGCCGIVSPIEAIECTTEKTK